MDAETKNEQLETLETSPDAAEEKRLADEQMKVVNLQDVFNGAMAAEQNKRREALALVSIPSPRLAELCKGLTDVGYTEAEARIITTLLGAAGSRMALLAMGRCGAYAGFIDRDFRTAAKWLFRVAERNLAQWPEEQRKIVELSETILKAADQIREAWVTFTSLKVPGAMTVASDGERSSAGYAANVFGLEESIRLRDALYTSAGRSSFDPEFREVEPKIAAELDVVLAGINTSGVAS